MQSGSGTQQGWNAGPPPSSSGSPSSSASAPSVPHLGFDSIQQRQLLQDQVARDIRACFMPWNKLPQTDELKAILGCAGAVALVGMVITVIWFCLFHNRSTGRTSETGSSDPSVQVRRSVGVELTLREARRFEMEELALAGAIQPSTVRRGEN